MASNVFGSFEDALEQGVSTVKQQVKQQASTTVKSATSQVTGSTPTPSSATPGAQGGQADIKALTDQFNETATKQPQQSQTQGDDLVAQAAQIQQMGAKSQEEQQQKLLETRKELKLHQDQHTTTYFDPTFNKRHREPTVQERLQQEEQVVEQKKMADLEEQKKKAPPIALRQAQTRAEINRGSSG